VGGAAAAGPAGSNCKLNRLVEEPQIEISRFDAGLPALSFVTTNRCRERRSAACLRYGALVPVCAPDVPAWLTAAGWTAAASMSSRPHLVGNALLHGGSAVTVKALTSSQKNGPVGAGQLAWNLTDYGRGAWPSPPSDPATSLRPVCLSQRPTTGAGPRSEWQAAWAWGDRLGDRAPPAWRHLDVGATTRRAARYCHRKPPRDRQECNLCAALIQAEIRPAGVDGAADPFSFAANEVVCPGALFSH